MGEMDRKEARQHPDKNIITRAVGAAENVDVDFFEVDLSEEDTVLLCSDGLTNMVDDASIYRIVKEQKTVEDQVSRLVRVANENGGRDNITAVIIRPFLDEVKTC